MPSVVAGIVIEKAKDRVYLDTKNAGTWDKIVICDSSRNLHSRRLDDQKVGYNAIYKLIRIGDKVSFLVNLIPALLPNTRMIQCGNLCGEPVINGQGALTLLTEQRAKETIRQLSKDADYDMNKMLNFVQNFVHNKQK